MLAAGSAPNAPPHSLDTRLIFERIAGEPEIVTPTGIAVDHKGRILVVESHTHFRPPGYQGPPADRVRVFEDRDHDGKPECVGSFVEGTRMTMSVAIAPDGSVFVATRSALYRFDDRDGDGRADGTDGGKLPAPIVRLDTRGDYPHNGLSGFAFDFDGTVYFGLGENLGADYRLKGSDGTTLSGGGEGGNIYRCRPDGSKVERIATGFWNPFHVAFDAFGRLFAVDNDPDSRPPCRLLHIVEGGDYGYRFRNGRKGLHPFTAWNGELPGTLGMVAGTGEAPCGVIAYEWDQLPEDYRGSLLVTSWGDHRIEQYRLEPRGASFRAMMKPVVAGGEDFRPVGIAAAPDGSLYVSDWVDKSYTLHGQGRIWRLRSRAQPRPLNPRRWSASKTLDRARRHSAELKAILTAASPSDHHTFSVFLTDESADVRAMAVRLLPSQCIDLKAMAAADPSPLVRARCAAQARRSDGQGSSLESPRFRRSICAAGGAHGIEPVAHDRRARSNRGCEGARSCAAAWITFDPPRFGPIGGSPLAAEVLDRRRSARSLRGDPVGRPASARSLSAATAGESHEQLSNAEPIRSDPGRVWSRSTARRALRRMKSLAKTTSPPCL